MENPRVASVFEELADRLELLDEEGANARAYRSFASEVRALDEPLAAVHRRGELLDLAGAGAGRSIAAEVDALLTHGTFDTMERARGAVPSGVVDLLRLPGLGVRTARSLWRQAEVVDLEALVLACEQDRIARLAGFGEKSQARLLATAHEALGRAASLPLSVARMTADVVNDLLVEAGAARTSVVGAARRGMELLERVEILVQGASLDRVARALGSHEARASLGIEGVVTEGEAVRAVFDVRGEAVVRCVADEAEWVGELLDATGDHAHVRWLEDLALPFGGLRSVARGKGSEAEVYRALGVSFVPPELRAGPRPEVPDDLLEAEHVRGIFHVHTEWSDGAASILTMAKAAARRGYEYIGITEHSQAASYAGGLGPQRLREQARAIDRVRSQVDGICILHGIETDILADGALDLDDETLAELDFVVASVHSSGRLPPAAMTSRLERAIAHPSVTIVGHPTGRLLPARQGYGFDLDRVARAAAKAGVRLEINANGSRLDLSAALARRAASCGATFAIDPDAHTVAGLDDVAYGVAVARRAGLRRRQVLNTMSRDEVVAHLARRKSGRR